MDYHIMYNDLIKKVNSLFKENSNIRKKIYKRINYSPMQISEQKDWSEEIVREMSEKFHVTVRFFRDFIERIYISRMVPFHSYTGFIEAHDLLERFMGNELAPISLEAILAIAIPWEKILVRNLLRMFVYDDIDRPDVELQKLVILICGLEEAKRHQESKGGWSSDIQSLSKFYEDEFMTTEMSDMEETEALLEAIRGEENYKWYLNSLVFPIMLQKYENHIFDFEDKKSDSWRNIWERINQLPKIDGMDRPKHTLENSETMRFIIKDALMQYHTGSLHLYHPMWIFGSRNYWMVLHDYLIDFQLDFECYQMQRILEEV